MSAFINLTKDVEKFLIDNDRKSDLKQLQRADRLYNHFYTDWIPRINSYKNVNISTDSLILLQANIHRSILLCKSFVDGLASRNPLICTLSARAHFETCGVVTYFHKKYAQYLSEKIDEDKMKDELRRLLYGVRNKQGFPDDLTLPEPISVMNLIDSVDYFNDKVLNIPDSTFRDNYEHLSEICHPNSFSNVLSMSQRKNKFRGIDEPYSVYSYNLGIYINSVVQYFDAYLASLTLILENEDIPKEFKKPN